MIISTFISYLIFIYYAVAAVFIIINTIIKRYNKYKYLKFQTPLYVINIGIDYSFTTSEKGMIIDALSSWQEATHNLVVFHIAHHNMRTLLYNKDDNTTGYAVNFVKASSEDLDVRYWDDHYNRTILGFAIIHSRCCLAFLVADRMRNKRLFTTITGHEIGHLLGLGHNPNRNTLMYEYSNYMAPQATNLDLQELIFQWRKLINSSYKQEHMPIDPSP